MSALQILRTSRPGGLNRRVRPIAVIQCFRQCRTAASPSGQKRIERAEVGSANEAASCLLIAKPFNMCLALETAQLRGWRFTFMRVADRMTTKADIQT